MPANKDSQLELIEEDDGSISVYDDAAAAAAAVDNDDDDDDDAPGAQVGGTGGDEEEDVGTKRGGAVDDDPDPEDTSVEAKRIRRRNERRNKKDAQRQRETTLRAELQTRDSIISSLAERLNVIEQRGTQGDLAQLDKEIANTVQATAYWKSAIAEAAKKQDGATVAEATQRLQQCTLREMQLANVRQNAVNAPRPAAQINPAVQAHGTAWMARNSWYNPQGQDQTTLMVRSLDTSLMNEGYNPATPAYWTELDARVRRHKLGPAPGKNGGYNAGEDQDGQQPTPRGAQQPRSPVAGASRSSRAQSSTGTGYKLSAARVEALKEAGMWENPKLRAGAIQEYRDYDRKNGRS